nr:hypothetical protein [Oceanispirochaeta sp.]
DGDLYDGIWQDLTLREALEIANSRDEIKIITYPSGTYAIDIMSPLPISSELYLLGPDGGLTIEGLSNSQHFIVDDGNPAVPQDVYLQNLNLEGGRNATAGGGSIFSRENLFIYDCIFTSNTAAKGGAIYQEGGQLVIQSSIFDTNTGNPGSGGGIYITDSLFNGFNLVFTWNQFTSAGADGTCIFLNNSDSIISFSTFVKNFAIDSATIYSQNSNNTLIVNSVFESNASAPSFMDVEVTSGILNLTGSCVQSVSPYDNAPFSSGVSPGFIDILTVDFPEGPDGLWKTSLDTLHAADNSRPMVDIGNESYIPKDWFDADGDGNTTEPFPYDIKGSPRVQGLAVDAGAYESF